MTFSTRLLPSAFSSKKTFFSLFFAFFSLFQSISAQLISVAAARQKAVGSTVTVRGVVTNGAEFGTIRYLQDPTAGIGVFDQGNAAGFTGTIVAGDSVEVTGPLFLFNGLLEIQPVTSFSKISSGNALPKPKELTVAQLGESVEGQLVRVPCVTFGTSGVAFQGQTTTSFFSAAGDEGHLYLRGQNPLVGTPIPAGVVAITGILSELSSEYRLWARGASDLAVESCFAITDGPEVVDFGQDFFKIQFKTSKNGSTKILFGTSPDLLDQSATLAGAATDHEITLQNLVPGTIYWLQATSNDGQETAFSNVIPFATVSSSSGQIKVFFNRKVDPTVGGGSAKLPDGDSGDAILQEILTRIDSAKTSIDVAVYNQSRFDIRDRLVAAYGRGVKIRCVADYETSNSALDPTLPFSWILGNPFALMHNKFMVIDADSPLDSWVLSGSTNWSTGQIFDDANNAVFIQDQSLARTYRLEMDEMWGGQGLQPDLAKSRFSSQKLDDTPHLFKIGGIPVESRFSPSDGTSEAIRRTMASADADLAFGLLVFTKIDVANEVISEHQKGTNCRGIIDNVGDVSTMFDDLLAVGIDVRADASPGIFHHKYGVVDWLLPNSDPTVLTGSHNWSQSAEVQNDENTLIFHDQSLATMYAMAFEKAFSETPVRTIEPISSEKNWRISPNPATDFLHIEGLKKAEKGAATASVFDATGRFLFSKKLEKTGGQLPLAGLEAGFFVLKIKTEKSVESFSFQKI